MDLVDVIRLACLIFIGAGLVVLALNPTREDEEDYRNWTAYLDRKTREERKKSRRWWKDDQ